MKPKPISEQMKTLDKQELEMLESVENYEWISNYSSLDQFEKRKRELSFAAHNSIAHHIIKDAVNISININRKELNLIEELALKEGVSYETWILNSIYKSMRYAR